MSTLHRKPAVAGSFYPSENNAVEKYLTKGAGVKEKAKGIVVPHAGYIYSGKVAGLVYSEVEIPGKVILIGPNHTGMGAAVSVMDKGVWEILGNKIEIDTELAKKVLKYSSYAEADIQAHLQEHSLEVQLPFIIYSNSNIKFVPITMGVQSLAVIEDIGDALARAVEEDDEDILLVASSDMSHYISQKDAEYLDKMAIEKMELLDYKGLIEVVNEESISMCGAGPVAAVLKACKLLGSRSGKLVHYNTSAETSGDTLQVVGYAGMKIL